MDVDDQPGEIWTIRIKPLASKVPAPNRIRRLLKYALRACGLKCVAIVDSPAKSKNSRLDEDAKKQAFSKEN